jgi:Flp pilus assembly protein TadD
MTSRGYAIACGLALATLIAAYANHFQNDFHFDDDHTIRNNLFIRDVRNIPRFFVDPRTFSSLPANQSYRPLLTTTLALDYRIAGGLKPWAFHATSFALFVVLCAAMLVLYRRLMDRARPHPWNRWIALFAATWYALHTANAETVNYIIARSEILSTLGAVLSLLMFTGGAIARRRGLYVIPAALGVCAKEQGVIAAPLIMLYVALFERELTVRELFQPRNLLRLVADTWPVLVTCSAILLAGFRLSTTFAPGGASRWAYLWTQPFVILHYVYAFILPFNLSADSDWSPFPNPFDDRVVVGFIFVAALSWLGFTAWRRLETRPIAFGIFWFFGALVPTSSIVPFAEVMNDHRMFFPFVGLTLAAAWGIWLAVADFSSSRFRGFVANRKSPTLTQGMIAASVVLLLAHAYGTHERNIVWRTEESLWLDVTKKSPQNGRGLMTYGVIQMAKGRYDLADQYFTRALQYAPQYAYLHVNIGVLKGAMGDAEEAERHFREAQQYDPGNPVSYYYYARWLSSVGRIDDAAPLAKRALELSPGHAEAQQLLADIQSRLLHPARRTAGEAQEETPERWIEISLAAYRLGRYEECIDASQKALRLRPDYAEAYNNICAANNAMGRYPEAVAACERAVALRPDFALARNNLALAKSHLTK